MLIIWYGSYINCIPSPRMSLNYGCQQDKLNLDCFEQRVIEYLCRQANSLTNCAIYSLRRSSRQANQVDYNYYDLDKHLKNNKHYQCLFSQVAQQTLMSVCESFKSHFEVMQRWYQGKLEDKPKMPKYRKSGGMTGFTYPSQHLGLETAFETGLIRLPLGLTIGKLEGVREIYLPAPRNIHPEKIKEVRVFPRNKCFYAEWVYERNIERHQLNSQKALSIDPGVKNWLTCVTNTGDSFIVDGKRPNFWNRTLNREVAKHNRGQSGQRLEPHVCRRSFGTSMPSRAWSKKLALMTEKRNRRMRDYINKIARYIANYCIDSGIGTVVFGWNQGVKQESNLGKKNNQNFVLLPTARLKERLKVVLTEIGVNFVETEESYTSKASFLDSDILPTFGEKPEGWKPSGRRTTTKLYRTAKGWIINADCNGAANIFKKVASILDLDLSEITRGSVTCPTRLDLYPTTILV